MHRAMSAKEWLDAEYKDAPPLRPVVVPTPCRFGCPDSMGLFFTPEGCACWPDNHIMALCPEHAGKLEADSIRMIARWETER